MTKYQIFMILPQISHFHKNRNFFKYICNFLDQLLHPCKFYGRNMSGILVFIFASCEPLNEQLAHSKCVHSNKMHLFLTFSCSIRQRSDYIIGFVTPAISPNKSKKLTWPKVQTHNLRGKVWMEDSTHGFTDNREYPLHSCVISNKRGSFP